jgi:hypothetical protein
LTELELMGLLGRGDGGRYVPRDASWSRAPRASDGGAVRRLAGTEG